MSRSHRPRARWLVTGATGFIGSHLVGHLLGCGDVAVGLDKFATGSRANLDDALAQLPPDAGVRFEFIEADIRDPEACRRATDDVDCVLHQAALGSSPRTWPLPTVHSPTASTTSPSGRAQRCASCTPRCASRWPTRRATKRSTRWSRSSSLFGLAIGHAVRWLVAGARAG